MMHRRVGAVVDNYTLYPQQLSEYSTSPNSCMVTVLTLSWMFYTAFNED